MTSDGGADRSGARRARERRATATPPAACRASSRSARAARPTVSVLDVGSTKICCLIARLKPRDGEALRRRTHSVEVLGFASTRSRGIKSGVVVDLDEAEQAIRLAVDGGRAHGRGDGRQPHRQPLLRAAAERDLFGERQGRRPGGGGRHPARARRRRRAFGERRAHGAAFAADRLRARRQSRHPRPDRHAGRDARRRHACRHRRRGAAPQSRARRSTAATWRSRRWSRRPTPSGLAALVDDEARARRRLHRHGRRHDDALDLPQRRVRACRRDRRRRPARDARHRARALHQPRRCGAHQGAARLGAAVDLRREGHSDHPAGRRGRARSSEHGAALGADPHHPAAHRGDARDGARHAGEVRLRRAGRQARRADRRREPAHRPRGDGAAHARPQRPARPAARHRRAAGGGEEPGLRGGGRPRRSTRRWRRSSSSARAGRRALR